MKDVYKRQAFCVLAFAPIASPAITATNFFCSAFKFLYFGLAGVDGVQLGSGIGPTNSLSAILHPGNGGAIVFELVEDDENPQGFESIVPHAAPAGSYRVIGLFLQ